MITAFVDDTGAVTTSPYKTKVFYGWTMAQVLAAVNQFIESNAAYFFGTVNARTLLQTPTARQHQAVQYVAVVLYNEVEASENSIYFGKMVLGIGMKI